MEKLYGLIGEKLGHTYSPQIHNEILKETNIDGHYGLFQVAKSNLKDVVPGLKALSYSGMNVTIPYKTAIIKYLDQLSPEARKIGAVNVIHINENGAAIGYNTDYYGFGRMLNQAGISVNGERALILGTGGASMAVIQYLKDNGAKDIVLVSRDIENAKQKYPNDKIITYDDLDKVEQCYLVINSTPVGMYPNIAATPMDKKYFSKFSYVVDLIYNPAQTLFLKEADEAGLKTVNGIYMLVAQAVKSQEIWNNIEISEDVIQNIINLIDRSSYE